MGVAGTSSFSRLLTSPDVNQASPSDRVTGAQYGMYYVNLIFGDWADLQERINGLYATMTTISSKEKITVRYDGGSIHHKKRMESRGTKIKRNSQFLRGLSKLLLPSFP